MTQNRRLELLDAVSHPKKANSYDELPELLPGRERTVRELEKFPQSALSNDPKIGFLRQLANDDLEQFLSHVSDCSQAVRRMKHSACMQCHRSPKSVRPRASTKVKPATKKTEKTRGNATDLGKLDSASKTDEQETRQDKFDPWQRCTVQGSEVFDASGVYAVGHKGKGKGGWPINGNCDHSGQFGHAGRHCPRLDEAGKAAVAQRKGQFFKGSQKGNSGMRGSLEWAIVDRRELWKRLEKGFQTRPWAQNQYGKGFGKQKGLE